MTRRALLVGINKYGMSDHQSHEPGVVLNASQNPASRFYLPSLTTPVRDAEGLRELLSSSDDPHYSWDQITMLPDMHEKYPGQTAVTTDMLWNALETLFTPQGSKDELLFYFGGHGLIRHRSGILATSDTSDYAGGVLMADVLDLIQSAGEHFASITIILDCCTSGVMNNLSNGSGLPINTSIMTASFSSLDSYEVKDKYSIFSNILRAGLSGGAVQGVSGKITVTSLATYVSETFPALQLGAISQQPTFHGVFTNIPVLRTAGGANLLPTDIDDLTAHFPDSADQRIMMTHEHEGPGLNGTTRSETPESEETSQMLEFDYFKRLQTARLLDTDAPAHSLFFACGYDSSAQETDSFSTVYLTPEGQALWNIADDHRTKRAELASRSL